LADRPPPLALPLLTSWICLITPLLGSNLSRRPHFGHIRSAAEPLESLEIFRATFARCPPYGCVFLLAIVPRMPTMADTKAYFVIMCLAGVTAVGAAGEIAKVSQVFQPGARYDDQIKSPTSSPFDASAPQCWWVPWARSRTSTTYSIPPAGWRRRIRRILSD
jgi:hypothetical protein